LVTVTSTKETFRLSIVKVQLVLCFAPETSYEGQPHAFVKDIESTRSGGVQGQAWEQMLEFLKKNLKQGGASQKSGPHLAYVEPFDWGYYLMLSYEYAFGTASHHH